MPDTLVLHTVEQVKTLSDPLRLRILETLATRTMTTKQIAVRMGEKPTRLYHHMDALEHAGLIRLVETRPNRGTTERYYQTVANRIHIDPAVFQLGSESTAQNDDVRMGVYRSLFEAVLAEIKSALSAGVIPTEANGNPISMFRTHIHASPEKINELREMLKTWEESCDTTENGEEGVRYGAVALFYPLAETTGANPQDPEE